MIEDIAAGPDEPSAAEDLSPAHIKATGLDDSSGVENTGEPAHIKATGPDEPSAAENTAEPAHIMHTGLDDPSGAENTAEDTVDALDDRLRALQGAMDQLQSGDLDGAERAIEALEAELESTRD